MRNVLWIVATLVPDTPVGDAGPSMGVSAGKGEGRSI